VKRNLGLLLLFSIFILAIARGASALCIYFPFEKAISQAEFIFAGTVRGIRAYQTPRHEIFTEYQFDSVRYAKGKGADTGLVLTQWGSTERLLEDQVTFQLDHRYIVLTDSFGGHLGAMTCVPWHPFEIRPDSGYAAPVAHTGGYSIAVFDERHIVRVRGERWAPNPQIKTYDAKGRLIPQSPPPRETLAEEFHETDVELELEPPPARYWIPGIGWSNDLLRGISVWPHQDPGTRVTEEALLGRLAAIIARQAGLQTDSTRSK